MSGVRHPLTIEFALLGLVQRRPMHPYEIYQHLRKESALGEVWHIKQAHLYALLRRLEEEGFLIGVTETQRNRPPRRVLSLTARGREAFTGWMRTPVPHGRDFRIEFLAKLYFAHQEGADAVELLIAQQRRTCQRLLDDLDNKAATLPPDQPYRRLVIRFRRGQIQAALAWLDSCRAELVSDGAP
ncbi:MAG: PadR family transcriptional regulator [Roseiflexus sp.]|nr:PadR family transcriptional regulator [Roseiflexus sp.]MCS7287547.1 PadR family transcriptional regulator [Roseiflexus sp.]MDW8148582.1 PadR family transcriptional regulator [Roseiflexaceae bacterium]MDW8231768.1 PadR family transcriptional regulator [Roseiflexaceae bacterium]